MKNLGVRAVRSAPAIHRMPDQPVEAFHMLWHPLASEIRSSYLPGGIDEVSGPAECL